MTTQEKRERVIQGLAVCVPTGCGREKCPYYDGPESEYWGNPDGYRCEFDLRHDAISLLKAQEPRVLALEDAKEARTCWIEDKEIGITYPAIYECSGNPSERGQYAVFTVVGDADVLPEEFDDEDDLVFEFEEGHRWLWEDGYGIDWRCWDKEPTEAQRGRVLWE